MSVKSDAMRRFLVWGCVCGFLSVAFGAFGAHVLKNRLAERMLADFQTGVQYQMYHALALILVALCIGKLGEEKRLIQAGWCFLAGIALFSGSLYVLALSGITWFGAITPLGGVSFLAGWALLGAAAWKKA